MAHHTLVSPDGRETWVATDDEEADFLREQGFTAPSAAGARVPNRPGFVGEVLARASATTDSSERNSGATVDLTEIEDEALLQEFKRRQELKARRREESAARRAAEQADEDESEDDDSDEDESEGEKKPEEKTPTAPATRRRGGQQ